MSRIAYTRGLHDVGDGHFVWLLPSGTWGYSNSGLVIDGDRSLLVDTLFDEKLTAEMFAAMKAATGDTLVHVPADKVVYTGDILFIEGTPIAWAGPVSNWIRACDLICGLGVDVIVPGHGPLTDKAGVRAMRNYLVFVDNEARARHAAGMDAWEAAQDIALGAFGEWRDAERIAVTVDTIYREINNDTSPRDVVALFARMAQLEKKQKTGCTQAGHKH